MGDESLGIRVFGEATPENTRKAATLRQAYFKGQEDIRDWFEYHRNKGVNEGFTETYFGRRRYYHKQDFSVSRIRRQAGNQVIQGSAADIYKTAVGRVFKRICKEGWLGKVMFTGFIHDELLGEVANDINPGIFLKALREEFEVKITNTDGTPWCPLYMGFGYGMSWYEAKSVELPIKLQWEIVEKYGEAGFPEWKGDGRAFCDTVPDKLRDFEVRDIRNQLLDAESQGKEIKTTLNNQVLDCIKEDKKLYNRGIKEYISSTNAEVTDMSSYLSTHESEILAYLDKEYHIQSLYKDEQGNYIDDFEPSKETQIAIDQYCMLHATDRSKIDLKDIAEVTSSDSNLASPEFFMGEDDEEDENKLQKIIDTKIDNLGMYVDIKNKKVILKMLPANYMAVIQSKVNREGKGYNIVFKDCDTKMMYNTPAYLVSEDISFIQQLYIQYFKSLRG
jgi:DNA polymerase-1